MYICDALRDLVQYLQFKKRKKSPWRSVTFSKVAGCLPVDLKQYCTVRIIWDKVLKNGPRKICRRQPLKNLKWYGLLKQKTTRNFNKSNTPPWAFFTFFKLYNGSKSHKASRIQIFQIRGLHRKRENCYGLHFRLLPPKMMTKFSENYKKREYLFTRFDIT